MIITSTSFTLTVNSTSQKRRFSLINRYILSTICLVSISLLLRAQDAKMNMSSIAPDWHNKTFCDQGNGFDVPLINAPAFGYIGQGIKEASYNYTWEQKMNDGNWTIVSSGKAKSFIPSYNPPVLFHPKSGGEPIKYSWRLKVTDIANGNQTGESDIYTMNLASPLLLSYIVSSSKLNKNKITINLTVKGGLSNYSYSWSVADRKSTIPSGQTNQKDLDGIEIGVYQVEVSDGCSNVIKTIDTAKPSNE